MGRNLAELTADIDREGKIVLPEAGSLVVAGLSLSSGPRSAIASALKQQFRNAQADVTIARLRTVRIYVVGDVQRPGSIRSQSVIELTINALYAAGGPTRRRFAPHRSTLPRQAAHSRDRSL